MEKNNINIAVKASRTLGMLSPVLKVTGTWARQLVYNTLVRPILDFGCEVWNPDVKQLKKVLNQPPIYF